MTAITPDTIQWNELGFSYIDTGKSFRAYFKDGHWSEGQIESSKNISISEASPVFHYGQSCFEGLKAYRTQNGDIQLFRPDKNADRMIDSAERLLMEPYPKEAFIEAVHKIVKENAEWVPPYESGATLYIRPFLMGVGDIVGVKPADEYIFSIFVTPVGPYFKGGLKPANFLISDYDRAAPNGTGAAKVGGNYAAGNLAGKLAKDQGYADAIFLDPATKTKIEEVGSANFFAITADNRFITPKSPSILPSITKYSLIDIARERLGMEAVETDVYLEELSGFSEAGAMGTAAVITPIGSIVHGEHRYVFGNGQEVGSVTQRLYNELVGIQFGDIVAPEGWIQKVKLG
ncbi:branched-chain amino acid aminotransferase [Fundicoccus ignavus]|uniref:Branched-chain-amino-acid aminotransferase n=1 Tax=Fundicoccus ignavus TaxID=2664442 RepID=A0A844C9J4_9LACT|nr:branched-chain amino acid aminotransferase [Fundicoccus ignavus]MRJ47806.1 branched-chain amino acid aminotransferase [Fundicoccus ignavus]